MRFLRTETFAALRLKMFLAFAAAMIALPTLDVVFGVDLGFTAKDLGYFLLVFAGGFAIHAISGHVLGVVDRIEAWRARK